MNNFNKIKELIQPSLFQRLLKNKPPENAIIEVNNILATKPLKEITYEEISAIANKYKVDLRKRFIDSLKDLYLKYLKQCLLDNVLSDQDVVNLNHLKILLSLNDTEVEKLHNKFAGEIYKLYYDKAIFDGVLDISELESLAKLKDNLRLPTIIEDKITEKSRTQFMRKTLDEIVADGKISPSEWDKFTTVAKNLDVIIDSSADNSAKIEKLKLRWLIENGDLPIKEVSINLQQNERCYFTSSADWLEHRTVTDRINYGGPTARIRIMKGVYYRVGSLGVQRSTSEQLQLIDSGKVYITDKRVIFLGNKKSTNIPLSKILSIIPYSNGVGIEKGSGRSPIITVKDNADLLSMTLSRVIHPLQK